MTKSNYSDESPPRQSQAIIQSWLGRTRTWAIGLGLLAGYCWVGVEANPARAAQAPIHSVPGEAQVHSVINFRALAEMERTLQLPARPRTINPPMPRRQTNSAPGGGGGGALVPGAGGGGGGAFQAAAVPPLASPPLSSSFPALVDNLTVTPPDTHGAVGLNHIVTALNSQVQVQDRNGNVLSTISLNTFWQSLGSPDAFDPRVIYDPYEDRFVFTAVSDSSSPRSSVLIAVSQTGDPNAGWMLSRIDADQNNLSWADYDNLGFNKDWIVVTVNMFPILPGQGFDFSGVNIYVFAKTNLYTNGRQFRLLRDGSTIGFTMVPALTYDRNVDLMHLVDVDSLFLNYNTTSRRLRLSTISGPIGNEVLNLATGYTTDTNEWASTSPQNFIGGFAPQLGTFAGIDSGDSRILDVVFRNGSLWCAHTVLLPGTTPNHSAAQWWQIETNGATLQFGRIEDPAGITFYAYPTIGVNRNGDALLGFSRFSPFQYPSANYAYRACSDPPNELRTETILKDGEAPYFASIFFGTLNRWGDYSATMPDPRNDLDLWTIQEYAASPTNGVTRWATWWGRVVPTETCQKIEFLSSIYNINEATPGFATINVLNIGGAPGTVDFATSDGTAIAGIDYLARSGTLTFAAGQLETNFIVVVLDNAVAQSNKTVELSLFNPSGPATLGRITNATLVIQDDETALAASTAGELNFSSFVNGGFFYRGSEFEANFVFLCGAAPYTITGGPERNSAGVLVTVVRTNGSSGRVLVDYETADGGSAIPFVDYTPVQGTLVFDDYQMSTNFVVEVFPEPIFFGTNFFFSPFTFGLRFIRVVLSNPRPALEEEAERPGVIRPILGLGKEGLIQVHGVNVLTNGVMFERRNWRFDEYTDNPLNVGGYRVFNIQVINPSGQGGCVRLRTREYYEGTTTPPVAPAFPPGGWGRFILDPKFFLMPGSDFAESPEPGALVGTKVWTPGQIITDPALTTITNFSDFLVTNVFLQFASGECRKNVFLVITNDPTVEFNEDMVLILDTPVPPCMLPVNPFGNTAAVTILFDDQPAGAVDREWNVYNLASSDPPFNRTPGADGLVRSLAVQPDGKTVLGGDFQHVNAVLRGGIARMNTNGSLDLSFQPGLGVDGFVSSIVLYPPGSTDFGKILVGGEFGSYDGVEQRRIARILPNGQFDPTFSAGNGANGTVWAIALQSDGKILVSGSFTEFNDFPRSGVARLNPDGSLDLSFNVGSGADGTVWAVGTSPVPGVGDLILLAGDFINFNNEFNSGIVRLNPDGSVDPNFQTGGGVNGPVYAMAVQTNGLVIVGGSFSEINARSRINVARFNPDGSLDSTFSGGFGPDGPILAITLQPDGKALIGGPFSQYNGTRRLGFARLRLNGTLDTSFLDTAYNQFAGLIRTFSFEPPNYATTLAVEPSGNIMVGGSFTNIGGNPSWRAPLRNPWTVFTRADKEIRFNIARVIGGATPGPGNAEFESDEYYVNENADLASIQLQRTDGRLGSLVAIADASDRVATNLVDYTVTNRVNLWPEGVFAVPIAQDTGPVNVGQVSPSYFRIPIFNDSLQEGDETVGLGFIRPEGSLTLSGEYIPLGGALGRASSQLNIADDDVDKGIFNFALSTYYTNENAGVAQITVIRTNGSVGLVSVQAFTRAAGITPLATPNLDYRPVFQPLVFASGVTSQVLRVSLIDDNLVEFDENIELVLTNAQGGAKLPGGLPTSVAVATLNIIDNDFPPGRLNFGANTYTTNESAGFATVTVTRSGGSIGAVSVQYTTADGTATAPADYAATSGTLTWADGDSGAKSFTVPLVADGIVDSSPLETFSLHLSNPKIGAVADGRLLGIRTNSVYQIEDSDAYGVLSFNQSFLEADENSGSVNVAVVRRNGIAGTVSVNYTVTPADPLSPGRDYVPTGGTLTFLPGESSKTFTITLLDDNESDGNKALVLGLSGAVNATLGSPNPVTLTLVDNESFNVPAGELDTAFRSDTHTDGPIYALGLQAEGKLVIAGEFTEVDNVTRTRLARLMDDGALDPSFDPGSGPNGVVRTLLIQPDSKILFGGSFNQYNGTNRGNVARVNSDGTIDAFFNIGSGANNPVYALALQPDDRILVAGAFSTFNGIVRPAIARLNTNGTVDLSFSTGGGPDNTVYAVALQSDGKLLIGGEFTAVNGTPRPHLARLNRNGSLDLTFNPVGIDGAVRSILVQPDRKIVIGGSFRNAAGQPRNYLARFNHDSSLDSAFLDGQVGADEAVFTLAQQVDGKLLVAGDFRTFNGVTRNRLTRLREDGTTDPTINFGNGANSFVSALVIQPDRKIVFSGGFTTFDDRPRPYIARIHGGAISGSGGLEFIQREFLVHENETNAIVTMRRRFGTTGAVAVNYRTLDGTALAGVHYQATAGTATFAEGETRFSFLVPIIDNSVVNGDHFLGLELIDSTFVGGATNGPQPVATLVILDDEGSIGFAIANYDVGENVPSGLAPILVTRLGGTNLPASVNFATSDGTATAGSDYFSTNGTITFLPGETAKTFHVRIINDSVVELNETVLLTLSNPSGSNALGIATATLLIRENDFAAGQFVLSSSTYQVIESSTNVVVTVLRTNGTTGVVSVRYRTVDNTAFAGADYVALNNVLAFADGESAKDINIPIIDDLLFELPESFDVRIGEPTGGASLGSLTNATVNIIDDDTSQIIPAGATLLSESLTNNNIIDPNETVTMRFQLRNVGSGNTVNLIGTLLPGNGVNSPSAPQVYGVLEASGAPVGRDFTFTASGNAGDRLVATLLLTDAGLTNGSAAFAFTIGGVASRNFGDTNQITILDNSPASPYPASVNVRNMGGTITKVSVTVSNLSHGFPADIDMMLVSPAGEKAVLMSDAGGTSANPNPLSNVTITFDSTAATVLPATARITPGSYRPANYAGLGTADAFPPPAPAMPYTNTDLSVFIGATPNGIWSLYVVDDNTLDVGSIKGWSVTIQTSDPVVPTAAAALADVGVVVASSSTAPVVAGANVVQSIQVRNTGPGDATSVGLVQQMPAGLSFVAASTSAGTWRQVGKTFIWNVGTLPSGANASLTLAAQALSPGTHSSLIEVAANQMDPNTANNSATITTRVVGVPSLTMTRVNNVLQLTWPADSGFKLQVADRIGLNPAGWSDVPINPSVQNGQSVVVVGIADGQVAGRFYRLRSP